MPRTIIENKADLMRNLGCTRNSYFLVRYGMNMISHYANHLLASSASIDFAAYDVPREGVATLREFLRNMADAAILRGETLDDELDPAIGDAIGGALRLYQHEVFEHIRAYANATGQFETFRGQPWYQFARIIRNSIGHNWVIHSFFLNDDEVASFDGHEIRNSDDGRPMGELGVSSATIERLAETMTRFAQDRLRDV